MVFLINAIPSLIILLGAFVTYKVKGWKNKVTTVFVVVGLVILYGQLQPSYIPKGVVKSLPSPAFQPSDAVIVDLALKPKTAEFYDAHLEAQMQKIQDSLDEQIKSQSKDK